MYHNDFAQDIAEQDALTKKRNKKKLNELLDKYGESKEALNQNADLKNSFDYMFAQGDELIDEVLEERRIKRAQNSFPQTPYPTIAKSNPNYITPDNLPETEEENSFIHNKSITDYKLGTLSSKYESLKNPAAIGYDNAGGYSYGVFQIETKHGTMKDYLDYLAKNRKYQPFSQKLQNSGGYTGALNKTDNFVNTWKELAKNKNFVQSQYQFIFDIKFKPLLRSITKIDGFDIEKRHPIIKDVLFSMAVQHGQRGALQVIKNALENNVKNLDDEGLINKLYDERSKVDKYLVGLPLEKRNSIKQNRYPNERRDALTALKE